MDHRRATMTTAVGRVRTFQLFNHLAHLADRQEVISFDRGFTGHIRQGMFLPRFSVTGIFRCRQVGQEITQRTRIHLLDEHIRHCPYQKCVVIEYFEDKADLL